MESSSDHGSNNRGPERLGNGQPQGTEESMILMTADSPKLLGPLEPTEFENTQSYLGCLRSELRILLPTQRDFVVLIVGIVIGACCAVLAKNGTSSLCQSRTLQNDTSILSNLRPTNPETTSEPQPPSSCPPNVTLPSQPWIQNGTLEYLFSDKEETWNMSLEICACLGASLVTLDTPEERAFIEDSKVVWDSWIDVWRESKSEPWRYSNGTAIDNSFEISNNDGFCGYWNVYGLSSTTCDNTQHYICRRKRKAGVR